jgi:hypothetical protein
MKRKKHPLEQMEISDAEVKGKVSAVLSVLSGEKRIVEVCRETGITLMQYYRLEGRMIQAMVETAKMPPGRGRRKNPMQEMGTLAEKTEILRQEHRRMQSLMRISQKLVKLGGQKSMKKRAVAMKSEEGNASATST